MKLKTSTYIWIGIAIIFISLSGYIMFIVSAFFSGHIKLITELSPIGTVVTLVVNTIFTLMMTIYNISRIDQKAEAAASQKMVEQRNAIWMGRYRDERVVLTELLESVSSLWVNTIGIIDAVRQENIKKLDQSNVDFGKDINNLLHKSADMITPIGVEEHDLQQFITNFELIRPKNMLGTRNEQTAYLSEIQKSEYFYNAKNGGFIDTGNMIHILIEAMNTPAENINNRQKEEFMFNKDKLALRNKKRLISSLENETSHLFGILFILENEIAQRIRDMRKYEERRATNIEK